ncbi:gamma-mobile-trio protein GmtX [Bosea sp. ANAM02]|uniref:gamma-mobile-trio protein GmtX n=1 Tax=Bosea sp. ANAM02 TaxID=2020412 RepID=UPI00140EF587|nr:gamma-mobile-trio protein GmtX [Bosea sp. ANAM02]BCB22454.1 hypothetical protein OCUBac02_53480 [Bosea sp. ANAM02]
MSDAEKQATQVVEEILKRLVEAASTDTVRVKLRNLNEACSHLIMNGKQRLTVPLVLSTYAAMFPAKDQSIAESSIRNKRGGANPYLELYRAWEDAGEVILARPRKMGKAKPGEIIDYTELSSIPDPTLRHQVKLLIAQNTSLKSQLDIVRQVKNAPTITLVATPGTPPPGSQRTSLPQLAESEVEAIRDFVAERKLKSRGLAEHEDGSVTTRDGRDLADPGFVSALRKILAIAEGPQ